ncbi:MAG: PAS domain S-box protein [Deltaproteobacteria bacterium]|nr:PAS domain S-box protein [Deltaproteobacteria bacterium]
MESEFYKIIESAPDGVLVVDSAGKILISNTQAQKLFGYSREELAGTRIETLMPARLRDSHLAYRESYALAPRNRPMGGAQGLIGLRKDGTEFSADISLSPIETEEGHLVIATVRDITERKNLEEQLRQSQKMEALGLLAGGIAHDFNNLLTTIIGYSDLLLNDLGPDDPRRKDAEEIKKAGKLAASLTRQLLTFSQKKVLQPKVLDLNAIIITLEKIVKRLLGQHIDVTIALDPQLGRVRAEQGQIEQVILNLAVNARDAMPNGGKLMIETANVELDENYARAHIEVEPGPYVMLSFSDTGLGMDAETRSRIFDPFFTTKEHGKGTGLGLAAVYGAVKQGRGSILVYSEPGKGTVFKIYLPRVEEEVEIRRKDREHLTSPGGGETILVVEHEEPLRDLVRVSLEQKGYRVLVASSADEAIRSCEQYPGPIHLMITDLVMPQMDGRRLAGELGAFRPEMKVLYMSGYAINTVLQHGVLDPNVPFLEKPFTSTLLARKVREVLSTPLPDPTP